MSDNCVPVAVNLYKVRKADDAGGDLFRSVQRQKDQYQGIWIVSPDGKVLAGHHDIKSHQTWTQEVLATISVGLEAYGDVKPRDFTRRNPQPFFGCGVQSDGQVTLAVFTRYMHLGKADGPAVIDSLTLDPDDFSAFFPPKLESNARWRIPDEVARRLCRVLSPSSDQSTMPRPNEVTDVDIVASVERLASDQAAIRFEGKIAAAHQYENKSSYAEMQLSGVANIDVKTGRPKSLLIIGEGTHRSPPPYDKPRETGAVVRWTTEQLETQPNGKPRTQ